MKWDVACGRFRGLATVPAIGGKLENLLFWLAESQGTIISETDFRAL